MKTWKAASKRLTVSGARKGKKKVMHRYADQDHFNGKQSGSQTRKKRRDNTLHESNMKNVKVILPNQGL